MPRRRRWSESERILHRTVNGVMAWHRCTRTPRGGANGTERNGTKRNETTGTRCRVSYAALACVASITRDLLAKCFSARIYVLVHRFASASLLLILYPLTLLSWLILLQVAITLWLRKIRRVYRCTTKPYKSRHDGKRVYGQYRPHFVFSAMRGVLRFHLLCRHVD